MLFIRQEMKEIRRSVQPLFLLGSSSKKEDKERALNESKNNVDKESAQRGYEVRNRMEYCFSVAIWNVFNHQTDTIDDDDDNSSSINDDQFQFATSSCTGDDEISTCYNESQATLRKKRVMISF